MAKHISLRTAMAGVIAGTNLLAAHSVLGAGFALQEQNVSGLGNAYAGSAAVAEDASTIFFNAAGLTELTRPSLVVSGNAIDISSKFKNSGSVAALGQSLGGEGGNAGGMTVLPALYMSVPVADGVVGGVGINAPFGLKTDYDSDWLGRFQAIKSDVKTTNINTSLAFKVNKMVSVGIGADYQSLDAELTKEVNYTAAVYQASSTAVYVPGLQGAASIKGSDSAWGFDVGVLLTPVAGTKLGLSYRSAMKYNVQGDATFNAPTTTSVPASLYIAGLSNSTNPVAPTNGPIMLAIKLPASARLAVAQKVGNTVELLGEVSWTQWSSIPELRINRPSGAALSTTPERWENTWRYALGANFQVSHAVKLRAGVAQDKAPVPDATRTPRLPDKDRTWISAGAQFELTKGTHIDLGYSRVSAKDATLNQNDGSAAAYGLIYGKQQTHIDIFGVQATVSF
jgi:long-chain fatty acid transport protein